MSAQISLPYLDAPDVNGSTYLWLPLDSSLFEHIPETLEVFGNLLTKRPEFHVTIGCLPEILVRASQEPNEENETRLVESFNSFVAKHPIAFEACTDDIRFAEKQERRSVLVRCRLSNLDGLYELWEGVLGTSLHRQPAHVTLYSLAPYPGIGIHTVEDMENLQQVVLPEVSRALVSR